MCAYIVVALLTGARTKELRALTWDHVFRKGEPDTDPPQPPHIAVWRSVRRGGDTKTWKSRRSLALRARCVEALWQQFEDQGWGRLAAGDKWEEHGLVFSSAVGKPLDAANVRRALRQGLNGIDGIDADEWTRRGLRYSRDRGGLPEADLARDPDRRRGHGRHLQARTGVAITQTQIDTQAKQVGHLLR